MVVQKYYLYIRTFPIVVTTVFTTDSDIRASATRSIILVAFITGGPGTLSKGEGGAWPGARARANTSDHPPTTIRVNVAAAAAAWGRWRCCVPGPSSYEFMHGAILYVVV